MTFEEIIAEATRAQFRAGRNWSKITAGESAFKVAEDGFKELAMKMLGAPWPISDQKCNITFRGKPFVFDPALGEWEIRAMT